LGRKYNEIRAILSHLNEVTPTAAILNKVEAKTDVIGSVLDVKEVEDHRNKRLSMLAWRNYFFGFADNPRRNNTKISRV
jgi:hypothetical protein